MHDPGHRRAPGGRARRASCGCGAPSCSPATPTPPPPPRCVAARGQLVPQRRPRGARRRGVAAGRRAPVRHHHPGRREHLRLGGGGRPRGPPRRPPRRGRGRARPRRRASGWPPSWSRRAPFDLDACRAWFAARGVTRFKTPEIVTRLDALPVLAAGKPDRALLRKMAAERRP